MTTDPLSPKKAFAWARWLIVGVGAFLLLTFTLVFVSERLKPAPVMGPPYFGEQEQPSEAMTVVEMVRRGESAAPFATRERIAEKGCDVRRDSSVVFVACPVGAGRSVFTIYSLDGRSASINRAVAVAAAIVQPDAEAADVEGVQRAALLLATKGEEQVLCIAKACFSASGDQGKILLWPSESLRGPSEIPLAFRGHWNAVAADCGTTENENWISIGPTWVDMVEAPHAEVLKVDTLPDRTIALSLRVVSEGVTWQETRRLQLSEDGRSMHDFTDKRIRFRCAK